MKTNLVYGVGINDADYVVQPTIEGKQVYCHFYRAWQGMLHRCYDRKYQAIQPTYFGCSVSECWLRFSNFKSWMENQGWTGRQLDKDILFVGNKVYSPETCAFVSRRTNNFLTDSGAARGHYPLGVALDAQTGKFRAQCRNPFTKKHEYLGYFQCSELAHLAWKKRKHELALQLADLQTDERVAQALRTRYL